MLLQISDIIRQKRREKGMTQTDLSVASGVSFRVIQRIEAGEGDVKLESLTAIAGALGVKLADLFSQIEMPEVKPRLSKSAILGPLSAIDGALILSAIAGISVAQRGFLLAILFQDETLASTVDGPNRSPDLHRAVLSFESNG